MHCGPPAGIVRGAMRLSVVTFLRAGAEPRDRPLARIVDYARRSQRRGCPGWWVIDSLGRGRPALRPLDSLGEPSGAAGGANAALANVVVALSAQAEPGSLAERAKVSFVCLPDDARQRLKRLERIGFDEVLVVSPAGALEELERIRDFL